MAFRLIRYAVAAMQRHLDAGYKKLLLVISVLFYVGKRNPYPFLPVGWMSLITLNWQKNSIVRTMLQKGLDRNTVMKMTGLSEDDLPKIRH